MGERRSPHHKRSTKKRAKTGAAPLISGSVRLQRVLAAAGISSRRGAERYLEEGRVTVNGRTAKLGDSADPAVDRIDLDGERLGIRSPQYWVLNKPVGVVTTLRDPERRATIADILPAGAQGLFPVGRLDIDTSGLLLLTNDGAMTQLLLHPSHGGEKTYRVTVKGELTRQAITRLERGMDLDGERTLPAKVSAVKADSDKGVTTFELTLKEGRNRQIRRSMLVLKAPVKRLVRIQVGPLRLGRLRRGEARPLRPGEFEALRTYADQLREGALRTRKPRAKRGAQRRTRVEAPESKAPSTQKPKTETPSSRAAKPKRGATGTAKPKGRSSRPARGAKGSSQTSTPRKGKRK